MNEEAPKPNTVKTPESGSRFNLNFPESSLGIKNNINKLNLMIQRYKTIPLSLGYGEPSEKIAEYFRATENLSQEDLRRLIEGERAMHLRDLQDSIKEYDTGITEFEIIHSVHHYIQLLDLGFDKESLAQFVAEKMLKSEVEIRNQKTGENRYVTAWERFEMEVKKVQDNHLSEINEYTTMYEDLLPYIKVDKNT
jgi:hypothetical protein